jgi:magnesium transporter
MRTVIVDCALYEKGLRRPGRLEVSAAPTSFHDSDSFVWLGLYEPTPEEFAEVRRHFGLHELAVEDALNAHQRPKLETYDESVFMVVKTARYLDADETIEFGEILVFIGEASSCTCATARRRRSPRCASGWSNGRT